MPSSSCGLRGSCKRATLPTKLDSSAADIDWAYSMCVWGGGQRQEQVHNRRKQQAVKPAPGNTAGSVCPECYKFQLIQLCSKMPGRLSPSAHQAA